MTPEATVGAQTVDRALMLLRLVAARPASTFTQLQVRSGLSKSTCSRLLLSLERNGLIRRDDGEFRALITLRLSTSGHRQVTVSVVAGRAGAGSPDHRKTDANQAFRPPGSPPGRPRR